MGHLIKSMIMREKTCWHLMGYSYQLAPKELLCTPSHNGDYRKVLKTIFKIITWVYFADYSLLDSINIYFQIKIVT